MNYIEKQDFFDEGFSTLRASQWTLFLARIFGKKFVGIDEQGVSVTLYRWRGVYYLTGLVEDDD